MDVETYFFKLIIWLFERMYVLLRQITLKLRAYEAKL